MTVNVLYIEDDASSVELVREMFRLTDFVLTDAYDGASGIAAAESQPPDVILLDIQLPGGSGIEIVKRMRQIPSLRLIPVIAVTADNSPETRERCLMAGCTAFVNKPISRLDLLNVIRKYLRVDVVQSDESKTSRKKVLIVEDNADLRTIFARTFTNFNVEVRTAEDGVEGLERIYAERPDVVILDVNMPRMGGFEVLETVRGDATLQDLKVILVTGNSMAPNDRQAELADLVLLKPVDIRELLRFAQRFAS